MHVCIHAYVFVRNPSTRHRRHLPVTCTGMMSSTKRCFRVGRLGFRAIIAAILIITTVSTIFGPSISLESQKPPQHIATADKTGGQLPITKDLCGFLKGRAKQISCSHLISVSPSLRHRELAHTFGSTASRVILNGTFVTPSCIAASGNMYNAMFSFETSTKNNIHYDEGKQIRALATPSLTAKDHETLSAVLWFGLKRGLGTPAELTIKDWELVDGNTIAPTQVSRIDEVMLPHHLWPSGHFLNTSFGNFAAVHQGNYGIGIFKESHGKYVKLDSTGFDDAGGENIGSLFEYEENLYLAARVNLKYHLRSMSGHGWRYPGIYKLVFSQQFDSTLPSVHGLLVAQNTNDELCCEACGGCIEEKAFSDTCDVDSDKWWHCLQKPAEMTSKLDAIQWSLRGNATCPLLATSEANTSCDFAQYYGCVQRCRSEFEKYHAAVSNIDGALIGLVGARRHNEQYFCHLGSRSLNYMCLETPMLTLKDGSRSTHPVMTSLVATNRKLTFLEMVNTEVQNNDHTIPSAIAHSWDRSRFCSASQQDVSRVGHFTIHVATPHNIGVFFKPTSCDGRDSACLDGCQGYLQPWLSDVGSELRPISELNDTKRHLTGHPETHGDLCLSYFRFAGSCTSSCEIILEFRAIKIYGLFEAPI